MLSIDFYSYATPALILFTILVILSFVAAVIRTYKEDSPFFIDPEEDLPETEEDRERRLWMEKYTSETNRGNRADWRLEYLIKEAPDPVAFDAVLECVYRDKIDLLIESITPRATESFVEKDDTDGH